MPPLIRAIVLCLASAVLLVLGATSNAPAQTRTTTVYVRMGCSDGVASLTKLA